MTISCRHFHKNSNLIFISKYCSLYDSDGGTSSRFSHFIFCKRQLALACFHAFVTLLERSCCTIRSCACPHGKISHTDWSNPTILPNSRIVADFLEDTQPSASMYRIIFSLLQGEISTRIVRLFGKYPSSNRTSW